MATRRPPRPHRAPQTAPSPDKRRPTRPHGHTFRSITDKISSIVLGSPADPGWLRRLRRQHTAVAWSSCSGVVIYLLSTGVGIWGIDIPVAWGFAITNFVWWIGIGHAGTLISAILLLLHQKWRTSINRIAEAMTIFAVMCAGLFPLLHLGRPWFFYWLLPYPNTMGLWPQFRSALVWDVFAVSTYFTVSLLFWYMGMIPDLATLRDRAQSRLAQIIYGMLAMGWRNSARHWQRLRDRPTCCSRGLATPLVVSVHSVVSSDFAISMMPGWHETVFPPYFVAGAIFSGFAMVLILAIPLRIVYRLQDFITHQSSRSDGQDPAGDQLAYLLRLSQRAVHGVVRRRADAESYLYLNRLIGFGQYAVDTWLIVLCNIIVPQVLWVQPLRRSPAGAVHRVAVRAGRHVARALS